MKHFVLPAFITLVIAAAMFLILRDGDESDAIVKGDLPDIELLLADSVTRYNIAETNGKKPVMLLFFNSTCDHCQALATELLKNQHQLQNANLVMASSEEISQIKKFRNQYSLYEISNLVIGKDIVSAGIRTFHFESYPFCAVYNKEHRFVRSFERDFKLDEVLGALEIK